MNTMSAKEGRKLQYPYMAQFSNFKWTFLRTPWTDSNDQGRKMTAKASTFRRFWTENKILIFSKCISRFSIFSNNEFPILWAAPQLWVGWWGIINWVYHFFITDTIIRLIKVKYTKYEQNRSCNKILLSIQKCVEINLQTDPLTEDDISDQRL